MAIESFKKRLFKLFIIIVTLYATIAMLHWPIGFTYFTQLSNIFAALTVIWQLICPRSRKAAVFKYIAAVSITVTFLVFLLVLAPLDPRGLIAAYAQDNCASLCLHLLTPLFTLMDFFINDARELEIGRRHVLLAILPPLAYYLFILALGLLGLRWRDSAAPYPFLNYAAPAGWFGFMPETAGYSTLGIGVFYAVIAMVGVFLLTGWALASAAGLIRRKKKS